MADGDRAAHQTRTGSDDRAALLTAGGDDRGRVGLSNPTRALLSRPMPAVTSVGKQPDYRPFHIEPWIPHNYEVNSIRIDSRVKLCTQERRIERSTSMSAEWQFLVTLNEQLRPLRDPIEIQHLAVRLIGEFLRVNRVHYAHIEGDEFLVSRSYADGVAPAPARGPAVQFGRALVDACRRGETVAVSDVTTDPRFTDAERERVLAQQTHAFVGVPL